MRARTRTHTGPMGVMVDGKPGSCHICLLCRERERGGERESMHVHILTSSTFQQLPSAQQVPTQSFSSQGLLHLQCFSTAAFHIKKADFPIHHWGRLKFC